MKPPSVDIRRATDSDWPAVWPIVREIVGRGDTYALDPAMGEAQARRLWMGAPAVAYLAARDGEVLGTYYIKPNQAGHGGHVCNAGYMVASHGRGGGVGRAMGEHSLREAAALGYRAMQFNLVLATNTGAVRLWRNLGFEIVGTLPEAFEHPEHGSVDAYVMHCRLPSPSIRRP